MNIMTLLLNLITSLAVTNMAKYVLKNYQQPNYNSFKIAVAMTKTNTLSFEKCC